MYCSLTGEYPCKCSKHSNTSLTTLGSALKVDLKASLRKVFSEHSDYTHFLIIESLPIEQPNAPFVTDRLLRNPKDIAQRIEPLVGHKKASLIKDLFTDHLKLAAAALPLVRQGDHAQIDQAVQKFYQQGDILAEGLLMLNPQYFKLSDLKKLIHHHNEFVVTLATLRQNEQYEKYIQTYDDYSKHMLMISDALYSGLTN